MRRSIVLIFLFRFTFDVYSKEGMWLPIFLSDVIGEMQTSGLKLSAEDIYSVNGASLKDAVVRFGGGCTGEVISTDGLLLTNHHCGYGSIQSHSSLENDYLTDGFWAGNRSEELSNPGLTATFIVRLEDVTVKVLAGIESIKGKKASDSLIKVNSELLVKEATVNTSYNAVVYPFSNGNQYILVIMESFRDVRLVGTPPSSIGKFGFDTDNWMWPRHTGDFSIFRIYAGKDNKPADYSPDNVPYKARHHFPISLKGYNEGDFTMVYGFPARTDEYLISDAVDHIVNVAGPVKINIRERKLDVLLDRMQASDEVRIKYAAKQSSTSNAWKKWIGQAKALRSYNALGKKREFESAFENRVKSGGSNFEAYSGLTGKLKEAYREFGEVSLARDYFMEIVVYGVEALKLGYDLSTYIEKLRNGGLNDKDRERLEKLPEGFFRNYDFETDLSVFMEIFPLYLNSADNPYKAEILKEIRQKHKSDLAEWMNDIYKTSVLTNSSKMKEIFSRDVDKALQKISKDGLYILASSLNEFYKSLISPAYRSVSENIELLNSKYILAIRSVFPDRLYYPDANSTLRVSYGRVEGMDAADAVSYGYYTTLAGMMEKYDSSSYEFALPARLIELHNSGDYGEYAQEGQMRLCFIASNHTSGGNSGSPVLNGDGHLIGLNFDRNWEGTMSDIMYDGNQCRNISVDIRYVLFIIDKFAGAGFLLDEMTVIR